jgi:hypothetical protein
MKAEQADLARPAAGRDAAGRDAALRRPRAARRSVPTTWLNLVCLDAPIVAVAWLWLFARTFHVPLQIGNGVALFLTAWLIYLGDRFADAISLKPGPPRSLRQEFCLRHREIWITTVALVAGFDAYVIWRTTAWETFLVGLAVGVLALVYLVANHPLGLIWRSLPAKELAIGILFAAGTAVALLPQQPTGFAFTVAMIAFAALCSLNCISIAGWERELDRAQHKISIATRHPRLVHHVGKICVALAIAGLALTIPFPVHGGVFVCLAASAFLLAWLNKSPIDRNDSKTALADLVLLTPLVVFIVTML